MPHLCDDCFDEYLRQLSDWAGVEQLVQKRIPESAHLDYKRDAYGEPKQPKESAVADKGKKDKRYELRKDATSLSNAGGGWLVLGIGEDSEGHPTELVGVDDLSDRERTVRDTLERQIFPPFDKSELEVRTVSHPSKTNHGIVVVRIGEAARGSPRGVNLQDGERIEFWIRMDKSNRPMRYEQIREAFRGGVELEEQRHLEGPIRVEIRKIQQSISSARKKGDWKQVGESLDTLEHFADPPQYGHRVRSDILQSVFAAISYPRGNCPPLEVVRKAFDVSDAALPSNSIGSMVAPSRTRPSSEDVELLRTAAMMGYETAYDGLKFDRGLAWVYVGAHHHAHVLKFSRLNSLDEFTDWIRSWFDALCEYANEVGNEDAVRLLDHLKADALASEEDESVAEPEGLEWVLEGEDSPRPDTSWQSLEEFRSKAGEDEEP
jgi:hypothetical protein